MGGLLALPTSLRARLAIVGSLAGIYILAYTFYIFGSPLFQGRQPQPTLIIDDSPVTTNGTDDSEWNQPRILLVTAMFQLADSKPIEDTWIQHFLGKVTTDIYIFTTPALESYILQLRGSNNIIIDTSYPTPFDIPPLKGKEDAYKQMQKKDRQKSKSRTPNLSALLNSKPFFLHTALNNSTNVAYDYVFWTDIANFHEEHQYRQWPSPARVRQVWEEGNHLTGTNPDELMFIPMWGLPHSTFVFWNENMGPIDNDFSQGKCCPSFIYFLQCQHFSFLLQNLSLVVHPKLSIGTHGRSTLIMTNTSLSISSSEKTKLRPTPYSSYSPTTSSQYGTTTPSPPPISNSTVPFKKVFLDNAIQKEGITNSGWLMRRHRIGWERCGYASKIVGGGGDGGDRKIKWDVSRLTRWQWRKCWGGLLVLVGNLLGLSFLFLRLWAGIIDLWLWVCICETSRIWTLYKKRVIINKMLSILPNDYPSSQIINRVPNVKYVGHVQLADAGILSVLSGRSRSSGGNM